MQTLQLYILMTSLTLFVLMFALGSVINPLARFWDSFSAFIVHIFSFVVLFLTPIANYVHIVIILIGIDLITGSYASIKAGEDFSAKKMRKTVEKFVFYALAIIIAYLLQRIAMEGNELSRVVAVYIGSIELKSNYENISRILKTDLIGELYRVLKDKLNSPTAKTEEK